MTLAQKKLARRGLCMFAALIALVIVLFPVYAIVVGSFESTTTLFSGNYYWLPHDPTLANYTAVFHEQTGHIVTSLIVGVGTALLALVVAVPAAYALSKYRLRVTVISGQRADHRADRALDRAGDLALHRLPLGAPAQHLPGTDPRRRDVRDPLRDPGATSVLLRLPNELLYAAKADGATEWQTFRLVVIPLGRSAIVTVAVFAFLAGWGDFIFALTVLNGSGIEPITLGIYTYLGNYSTDWGAVMAAAAVALVPAGVLLVVAQRYIASGLTAGAVKG